MFFRTVVSVIQNLKLLLKLSLLSFSFDPKWHPNRKTPTHFQAFLVEEEEEEGRHTQYIGGGLVLLWVVWQGRRFLKLTSHEFVIPFWFLEYIHTYYSIRRLLTSPHCVISVDSQGSTCTICRNFHKCSGFGEGNGEKKLVFDILQLP